MSLELSLYTLESQLSELIEMREEAVAARDEIGVTGEGLDDAMHAVAVIDDQIREYITAEIRKVDGIRAFWRHCDLMAAAAKEEAELQAARSKAWKNRLDRLKDMVKLVMETIPFPEGKPKKLEGRTGALYLKANGGKQAVEIHDESMVPDELCTVTVTMPLSLWDRNCVFLNQNHLLLRRELGEKAKIGQRVPSLSLIAERLNGKCEACEGRGHPRDPVFEEHISPDTCSECGGSGRQSVPGARFAPVGQHVECK